MSSLTLRETVELHLDALYERDAAGLILGIRGGTRPPPRVHLVRTVEGNRWLFAAALPVALRGAAEALLASEPILGALDAMEHRPLACRAALLDLLEEQRPPSGEFRGPAFAFPDALPGPALAIEVLAGPHLARPHVDIAWLAEFVETDRPVVIARGETGEAVAFCHSARRGEASAEAGVEVVEGYRRRGFARAVTLGWAHVTRTDGREPLYSTWWENEASRATARSLGLVAYAEDWHVD